MEKLREQIIDNEFRRQVSLCTAESEKKNLQISYDQRFFDEGLIKDGVIEYVD